jgi:hypothetical protein
VPNPEPTQVHGRKPGRIPLNIREFSLSGLSWLPRSG